MSRKKKMPSYVSEIKNLRKSYSANISIHRKIRYAILQEVAIVSDRLASDLMAIRTLEKAGIIKRRKNQPIVQSIAMYVTSSKLSTSRKGVNKTSRALAYLMEHEGVAANDIAAEIKKHGGIEKICRQAAAQDPKQVKSEDIDFQELGDAADDDDGAPRSSRKREKDSAVSSRSTPTYPANITPDDVFDGEISDHNVEDATRPTEDIADLDDVIEIVLSKKLSMKWPNILESLNDGRRARITISLSQDGSTIFALRSAILKKTTGCDGRKKRKYW